VATSDRRVVRFIRLFGGGAAAIGAYVLVEILVRTGHLDAETVAFTSMAIALTAFAEDVRRGFDVGLRVFFEGTPAPTNAEEAELLEHLLAHHPPAEKEPLWAVRLAELYRLHPGQAGRADALLDRMLVKYPTSRELQVARRHA
jgi:hypothetical protein